MKTQQEKYRMLYPDGFTPKNDKMDIIENRDYIG